MPVFSPDCAPPSCCRATSTRRTTTTAAARAAATTAAARAAAAARCAPSGSVCLVDLSALWMRLPSGCVGLVDLPAFRANAGSPVHAILGSVYLVTTAIAPGLQRLAAQMRLAITETNRIPFWHSEQDIGSLFGGHL
jgi:hypothetical protein